MMELGNVFKNGSNVWIYSKYNSKTIELSKKRDENGGTLHDVFIRGKIISYNSEKDAYECECDDNGKLVSILVSRDIVYSADQNFGYKDNSQLRNLNIGNVLKNIQVCYESLNKDCKSKSPASVNEDSYPKYPMYSFSGGILLAVNPYKDYDIYNENVANEFIGKNIVNMEPHPFAIAEWSYRRMLSDNRSQSIIISGESGAGKTETSKHVLKYLSFVSNRQRAKETMNVENSVMNSKKDMVTIEECLLSSNPLLEVFGNSKTIRNCNSSRFGKYMKLYFDSNGRIMNSCINTYLLAKSRVVHLPNNERNYHIFYHVLNEMTQEQKSRWGLTNKKDILSALDFNYLKTESLKNSETGSDISDFSFSEIMKTTPYNMSVINESFNSIGVDSINREYIYDMIISILLLGNLEYKNSGNQEEEECELTDESLSIIEKISNIWGFDDKNELIELLTIKKIVKIRKKLSYSEAIFTRDSIARYLYEWVFNNVVELINIALKQNINSTIGYGATRGNNIYNFDSSNDKSIGILDIFGFEDLEPNYVNSFEQLLINYCNERLHSFFLEQLLYRDTVLYKTEGINDNISTLPSSNVIDLLFQQSFVCTIMSGVNPRYLSGEKVEYSNQTSDSDQTPFKEKLDSSKLLVSLLPYNIISILDETGKIPMKGNRDHAFCNKIHMLNMLSNTSINKNTGVNRGSICSGVVTNIKNDASNLSDEKLMNLSDAISNVIQVQKLNTDKTFTINHFAGPVKYTSHEFISKNTDFLSHNIENVILSKIKSIREINDLKNALQNSGCAEDTGFSSGECETANVTTPESKLNNETNDGNKRSLRMSVVYLNNISNSSLNQVPTPINTNKNKSVSTMFVKQVQNMLDNELYSTQSHFIRCIKPNNNQISLFFDSEKVYTQLKIGGILQILNIMIYGYPCRIPYGQIYNYFKQIVEFDNNDDCEENKDMNLIKKKAKELLRDCRLFVSLLLEYMGYVNIVDYQLGLTRVFFKYNVLDKIEQFIKMCDSENSLEWKTECINSLYNLWIRRRCLNYWNMLRCCIKIYILNKHIRKYNAVKVIGKYIINYIELKRERLRKEQEEIERRRKEQEEIERKRKEQEEIERKRKEQEEIERNRKEQEEIERKRKEQEEIERRRKEQEEIERKRKEQEEIERKRKEQEEIETRRKEQEEIERKRKEQEEIERKRKEQEEIETRRKEQEEIERKRKEQEEIETRRKEQEEKELEREKTKIKQEKTEIEVKDIKVSEKEDRKSQKRNTKRARDDKEYNYGEGLYIYDSLEINKKKRATESIVSTENSCLEAISQVKTEISKLNNSKNPDSVSNSPLLCTSVMRGKKRYSIYYVTGNDNPDNSNFEARTLQDEIVEAEFNEEILNLKHRSGDIEVNANYSDNIGSVLTGYEGMKTGIKRPTVFIHNNIDELNENEKENADAANDESKGIIFEYNLLNDSYSKKKSLRVVQENFRSNLIKQKEVSKQLNK
ncbi:myosin [Cryptosporidium ryanae]|uniref:myosin n=1 Tax=Cryptosporidium ryanae TaxID=515981 RepID=UPI00351A6903|nr:myosin [Cryptosporidium ryanae]